MEFLLTVNGKHHQSYITNMFELKHLGIMNSSRMLLYVSGNDVDQVPIIKRVQELAICIIQYHGCGENKHPHPVGEIFPLSYHFSITGTAKALQDLRKVLNIPGFDSD